MKNHALEALDCLGPHTQAAIPSLLDRLPIAGADEVDTLWRIQGHASTVLPRLIQIIELNDHIQDRSVATVLGQIGPEAAPAIPALRTILWRSDFKARVRSAIALWQIEKSDEALSVLVVANRVCPHLYEYFLGEQVLEQLADIQQWPPIIALLKQLLDDRRI